MSEIDAITFQMKRELEAFDDALLELAEEARRMAERLERLRTARWRLSDQTTKIEEAARHE